MTRLARPLALAALSAAAPLAFAHTGAGDPVHAGFMQGLLHPLGGADHLLAMLALGAWSALALRRVWAAPAAFVAVLAAGALAGAAGLSVPGVEPMIAASLLVLGLLVATLRRLPMAAALGVAGAFAFFHGAAHGTELGASPAALAGMLAATALLHAAGIALGRGVLAQRAWLPRLAGGAVAVFGAALLLGIA